jgi:molybdopterin-guanine dinucleotide biosynthesis protein A
MSPLKFTGAVLAGGRSVRMGTDKARLTVQGEPLLTRQLRLLAAAGADARLVAGPENPALPLPPDVRWVLDRQPGWGPLAGLESSLTASLTDLLLVVAVDLPALTPELLRRLLAVARPGCGVVPLQAGGAEPLVALYPRVALAEITARLNRGERALQPLVRAGFAAGWLQPWPIAPADQPQFANWNRPQDLPFPL